MGHGFADEGGARCVASGCEPLFEPPPRLAQRVEQRLTVRAVAGFSAGLAGHEYRDNSVTMRLSGGHTGIVAVGTAVARSFGLQAGPCPADAQPDSLVACLRDACDVLRAKPGVVPFEAALRTAAADHILLRGVLLPQLDDTAEAVLSWKQVLDDDATARLRAELLRSMSHGLPRPPNYHEVDVFG